MLLQEELDSLKSNPSSSQAIAKKAKQVVRARSESFAAAEEVDERPRKNVSATSAAPPKAVQKPVKEKTRKVRHGSKLA